MMKQHIGMLLGFVVLIGCGAAFRSAPDFSRISVGMTKGEVQTRLSKPKYLNAEGAREMFVYEWDDLWDGRNGGKWAYVVFEEDRVIGYVVDVATPSTSFNLAEAWTRIGSAPRTNIYMQQHVHPR